MKLINDFSFFPTGLTWRRLLVCRGVCYYPFTHFCIDFFACSDSLLLNKTASDAISDATRHTTQVLRDGLDPSACYRWLQAARGHQ